MQPVKMSGEVMRKTAAIILPLIVIVPLSGLHAALSVSVIPPILELSVPPGGTKVFSLTVKNVGDTRVMVTPSVMDLMLSPTGAALPVARGNGAPSCAGWVDMDRNEFALDPGEGLAREVALEVPRGVGGGAYCVIVFEAMPVEKVSTQSGLDISTRTGTIVMETVSRRSLRLGEITDVKISKVGEDEIGVTAQFENKGDIHVQIRPSCVIKNSEGRVIDRITMDAGTGTVLPRGVRQITGTWANKRKMLPGSYSVQVSADYRGGRRASKSVELAID
jgi:hypothetical protein